LAKIAVNLNRSADFVVGICEVRQSPVLHFCVMLPGLYRFALYMRESIIQYASIITLNSLSLALERSGVYGAVRLK